MDRLVDLPATSDIRRSTGEQAPTSLDCISPVVNWVSPMLPANKAVSRPQGRGMEQGVEDVGKSEGRLVTERIGLAERREIPNAKVC